MKIFHIFELTALVVSVLTFRKTKGTTLVVMSPYLALINFYELGTIKGWFTYGDSNHAAANIFMLIPFSFYLLLLGSIFSQNRAVAGVVLCWVVFLILYAYNFVLGQKPNQFHSHSYLLGSLLTIGWCCYFFFRLLKAPPNFRLANYPFFWIFTGALFFYLVRFIFICYFSFLAYQANQSFAAVYQAISNVSIVILYSCITIGLICLKSPIPKM